MCGEVCLVVNSGNFGDLPVHSWDCREEGHDDNESSWKNDGNFNCLVSIPLRTTACSELFRPARNARVLDYCTRMWISAPDKAYLIQIYSIKICWINVRKCNEYSRSVHSTTNEPPDKIYFQVRNIYVTCRCLCLIKYCSLYSATCVWKVKTKGT